MLIMAHRGASKDCPENTLVAFEEAIKQGADGVEFDVFPCEDQFVVIHDKWLSRTTNGKGQIKDYTFDKLRQLDAGHGQLIPTLSEVLLQIGGRCHINIEVKAPCCILSLLNEITTCQKTAAIADNALIISSFHHPLLKRIKAEAPQWRYAALSASYAVNGNQFAEDLGAWSVNLDINIVDKVLVDDAHRRGLKVFVYTVDESDDLLALQSWGVDGVFTNRPAQSRQVLESS